MEEVPSTPKQVNDHPGSPGPYLPGSPLSPEPYMPFSPQLVYKSVRATLTEKTVPVLEIPKDRLVPTFNSSIALAVALILGGCCTNVIFLELIVQEDKGGGALVTFFQFCFITFESLIRRIQFVPLSRGLVRLSTKTIIPLWFYGVLTFIFFTLSVINNKTTDYNVSLPMNMVFRSSTLAASLFVGAVLFGISYSKAKKIGVALVSAGILAATAGDALLKVSNDSSCCENTATTAVGSPSESEFSTWLIGMAMLFVALFCAALLGHCQEYSYKRWADGKKSEASIESKLMNHLFALPMFLLLTGDLTNHFNLWMQSTPLLLPVLNVSVPCVWIYLIANIITQYICISGVYRLTAAGGTLSTTFALTIRKFLSIVLSVFLFNNPFTGLHWTGSFLVLVGVLIFTGFAEQAMQLVWDRKKKKED